MVTPSYTPASQPATATPTDYPFAMQSYPATNYLPAADDYPLAGPDDSMYNSWTQDELESSMTSASPPRQQQQQSAPVVPDAVINMAAKVGSDKQPFAYIANVNDIRQQRDRVRRKYVATHNSNFVIILSLNRLSELTV